MKPHSSNVFLMLKGKPMNIQNAPMPNWLTKLADSSMEILTKADSQVGKPNYMKSPRCTFRDHAYYIKYERPGLESDKVGYRFYFDQRNAIDVFGKKTS